MTARVDAQAAGDLARKVSNGFLHGDFARAHAALAELESRAARLEAAETALRWYADRRNYVPAAGFPYAPPPEQLIATDAYDGEGPGARARSALAAFDAAGRGEE